jgi:hypothetical protein
VGDDKEAPADFRRVIAMLETRSREVVAKKWEFGGSGAATNQAALASRAAQTRQGISTRWPHFPQRANSARSLS